MCRCCLFKYVALSVNESVILAVVFVVWGGGLGL